MTHVLCELSIDAIIGNIVCDFESCDDNTPTVLFYISYKYIYTVWVLYIS